MFKKNKKIKTVSMDSEMQRNGIDPSKIKKEVQVENPYYDLHINKMQLSKSCWIRFLCQLDLRQWTQILIWENVPNGIESWLINHMMYYRGSLAAFNFANGFYIMPYVQKGGVNPYGLPTKITPITYNGTIAKSDSNYFEKDFNLTINNFGNYNESANAVIYYSGMPNWTSGVPLSPYNTNLPVIEEMAEILSRTMIQIVCTTPKFIFKTVDAKQQKVILNQLRGAFDSESPFIVISDPALETIEIQPNQNTNASDFWIHFKGFNDLRNTSNGIENSGYFQKKERKNTSESESDTAGTSLALTDRLYFAKLFVEQCKKQFGVVGSPNYIEGIEKMSVRYNEELDIAEGIDSEGNIDTETEESNNESEVNK